MSRSRGDTHYSTVDFSGVLTIVNPESFGKALFAGIGCAKAFGCGLMLVKLVSS
ncbi:MAG: type I-E CRISPR-associated protein Cas6/Cse3/CasE [Nevskiales bacterium]